MGFFFSLNPTTKTTTMQTLDTERLTDLLARSYALGKGNEHRQTLKRESNIYRGRVRRTAIKALGGSSSSPSSSHNPSTLIPLSQFTTARIEALLNLKRREEAIVAELASIRAEILAVCSQATPPCSCRGLR